MDFSQQQILVTGGAGFIGQHVVRALLQQGARVVVLDDMSTSQRESLGQHEHLKWIEDTVAAPMVVAAALQGCSAVIHLAALASVPLSIEKPEHCFRSNVVGTEVLLDTARQAGFTGRIIIASSAAVYGLQPQAQPYAEALAVAAVPPTPYAASKRINEQQAQMYRTCYGLAVHALRFFNVYGPGQPMSPTAGALTRFAYKLQHNEALTLYGDGLQLRDYVLVHDVVAVILGLLNLPAASPIPNAMNVASGTATSLRTAIEEMATVLGVTPSYAMLPPSAGDVRYSCADIALLRATLPNWQPTPLQQGLQQWLRP